jgi:branched-chain amino acid transport system permease protein
MTGWYDANLVLIQATVYGLLLAYSVQFPLRMGVFSFAGVGSYAIGAYAAAIVVIRYEATAIQAIVFAMVLAGVTGVFLGLLVNRLKGLYLAMATVSFDLILTVIVTNGGDLTGGPLGLYGVLTDFTMGQMYLIVLLATVLIAFTEVGRLGRRIDTVRDDPELAASMGINVRFYRMSAFVVSGMLGACAGAMTVLVRTTIDPTAIGFQLIVLALTMIIVGGARSWKGALIGAVIFTWLPSILSVVGEWQHVIYGIIVAVAAIWLPGGLLGVVTDAYRWAARRRRSEKPQPAAVVERDHIDEELAALGELSAETSTEGGRA